MRNGFSRTIGIVQSELEDSRDRGSHGNPSDNEGVVGLWRDVHWFFEAYETFIREFYFKEDEQEENRDKGVRESRKGAN